MDPGAPLQTLYTPETQGLWKETKRHTAMILGEQNDTTRQTSATT